MKVTYCLLEQTQFYTKESVSGYTINKPVRFKFSTSKKPKEKKPKAAKYKNQFKY